MKKSIIILTAAFAFACNNAADKSAATASADSASQAEAPSADASIPPGITKEEYEKAVSLIATSDCLTCHKVEEKVTGPSYKDVSMKYEATDANIEMLAGKIIKGGTGVWGQVPMTPHDSISVDDAKTMVKYILALKNVK
jgi:cytochrome c